MKHSSVKRTAIHYIWYGEWSKQERLLCSCLLAIGQFPLLMVTYWPPIGQVIACGKTPGSRSLLFNWSYNLLLKLSETLKIRLLRRLQALTLPNATPPLGKIPFFTKIAVTFHLIQRFR